MKDDNANLPESPFLETWSVRIKLLPELGNPNAPSSPFEIRARAIDAVLGRQQEVEGPSAPEERIGHPDEEADYNHNVLRDAVAESIADGLSHPDFEYFVTDYDEQPGSWEIALVVVGVFYGGVCGYGAFRQGLEYACRDINSVFETGQGIAAKVKRRFQSRRELRPRIEPTMTWEPRSGKSSRGEKRRKRK